MASLISEQKKKNQVRHVFGQARQTLLHVDAALHRTHSI